MRMHLPATAASDSFDDRLQDVAAPAQVVFCHLWSSAIRRHPVRSSRLRRSEYGSARAVSATDLSKG